jgi:hypothetical protein
MTWQGASEAGKVTALSVHNPFNNLDIITDYPLQYRLNLQKGGNALTMVP